ncbi:hypothetical protein [Candidatus Regiella insecticola]|nr:hypothetical protein [Candidatus Regiella insecticola]
MYLNYNYFNKLDEYTLLTVPYHEANTRSQQRGGFKGEEYK